MIVKDFIEKLQQLDQDAEVMLYDYSYGDIYIFDKKELQVKNYYLQAMNDGFEILEVICSIEHRQYKTLKTIKGVLID